MDNVEWAERTPSGVLRAFESEIRTVVDRVIPNGIDNAARDADDYANHLRWVAWNACQKTECSKPSYVRKAIWNSAKSLRRLSEKRKAYTSEQPTPPEPLDSRRCYEARESLKRLLNSPEGWRLVAFGVTGDIHTAYPEQLPRTTKWARLGALRKKMRGQI